MGSDSEKLPRNFQSMVLNSYRNEYGLKYIEYSIYIRLIENLLSVCKWHIFYIDTGLVVTPWQNETGK